METFAASGQLYLYRYNTYNTFFFFLGGEKNANYDALIRASNRCGGVQLTWWGYKFDLSARDTQVRGGGVGGGDGGRLDGGGG